MLLLCGCGPSGTGSGEPMKPLSEKLKELERARDAEEFSSSARAAYTVCIEHLQVWLREAEEWRLEKKHQRGFHNDMRSRDVRRELLGTTRTEGEK